jgi:quercetin dioxygenase-like cupin family protein
VESLGVARFGSDDRQAPIPHLLTVMPSLLGLANSGPLILLKILDPLPEKIFGDLYFELHNEKREVYVVTHVDRRAWPNGIGRMRLGFQPDTISQAGSQDAFRRQFLQRVVAYRAVRFEIDRLLDARRREHAIAPNQPLPVEQLKRWLQKIPEPLASRERELRQAMEGYYGSLPLQAGDVVQVPLNVPHSLQHGVRTIEFQTPVYERRIVAFGQKVLTQATWDTEQAVEEMVVTAPNRPKLPVLIEQPGLCVERVVDFPDFQVQRITLAAGSTYQIHGKTYQLLIVIQGNLIVDDQKLTEEEAVLLPASTDISIRPRSGSPATFLVAIPSIDDDHHDKQVTVQPKL